jgi:hypothetical protein
MSYYITSQLKPFVEHGIVGHVDRGLYEVGEVDERHH